MTHEMPDQNHIGMHTLGRNISRYKISHFPSILLNTLNSDSFQCTNAHFILSLGICIYEQNQSKLIRTHTNLSLPILSVISLPSVAQCCVCGLENPVENIFTDLDHNHHHYLHHQKMTIIRILDDQEHNQLVHWHQLCLMIRIYRVGCQKITSKKVI